MKGERVILYLGIIDILQSYRFRKKVEHTVKSIIADGVSGWGGYILVRWPPMKSVMLQPGHSVSDQS